MVWCALPALTPVVIHAVAFQSCLEQVKQAVYHVYIFIRTYARTVYAQAHDAQAETGI